MCRLFGFRSAVPSRAHKSLVAAQNALVRQASDHADGWGLGWFHGDEAYVVKTAKAALDCDRFRRVSEGLTSHTFLAHLRRATVGELDHINAHPFRSGRWLFAHNGTVIGLDQGLGQWLLQRVDPQMRPLIMGDTDSELLFFAVLTRLHALGGDPTGRAASDPGLAARAVRDVTLALDAEASRRGFERPLLNVVLTDGRVLLAHKAGMPLQLSTQKHHCADAPTCPAVKVCLMARRPEGEPVNHLIVASEAIGLDENVWEDVEDGTTVVLGEDFRLRQIGPPEGWSAPVLPVRFRIAR
ncbi:MAG: class II glutamine amidotransferase [Myxococcota bacterium]